MEIEQKRRERFVFLCKQEKSAYFEINLKTIDIKVIERWLLVAFKVNKQSVNSSFIFIAPSILLHMFPS